MALWEYEQVCTAKMNLSEEVDLEDYVSRPDKISAAEVRFSIFMISLIPYYTAVKLGLMSVYHCTGVIP